MKYRYIGGGAFVAGLPACDLDDDTLTAAQREMLRQAADLYEPVQPAKTKPLPALKLKAEPDDQPGA